MEKILIIVCAIQLVCLGILIIYIAIEKVKRESILIQHSITEKEVVEWRRKLLEKIKERINLSSEAEKKMIAGEDAVGKFIYNQKNIKNLSNELFHIFDTQVAVLKSQYQSLTELDLLVILLLGIGLDNYEIGALLNMEKRTLYRRRQLIAQRMGISSTRIELVIAELIS